LAKPRSSRPAAERDKRRRGAELSAQFRAIELEREALRLEKAILVGLDIGRDSNAEESLEELKRLATTAGAEVAGALLQRREKPDPATFLGKGKAAEVRDHVRATSSDTVIVDEELSPGQLRNLEEICGVKVIDRTALILDIFAQHAHSAEGKLQVELAQLNYMVPRLRGWGESLSRLGGGIGTRGPGETKIEVDRRRIRDRISKVRKQLKVVEKTRATKRDKRVQARVPSVALVGYTNAGKSTLLNRITRAGVLVEDRLFSTLDPTTRRLELPDGRAIVMTDTVGFVRKLPHMLVEAFKSTLEEAARADLVLHIVDGAAADADGQAASVLEVLQEIGAAELPQLVAVNKIDALHEVALVRLRRTFPDAVFVSALSGEGLEDLLAAVDAHLPRPEVEVDLLIPYDRGDVLAALHAAGAVRRTEHTDDGTLVTALLRDDALGRLERYVVRRPGRAAHRSGA
jgi:GTPase